MSTIQLTFLTINRDEGQPFPSRFKIESRIEHKKEVKAKIENWRTTDQYNLVGGTWTYHSTKDRLGTPKVSKHRVDFMSLSLLSKGEIKANLPRGD